MEFYRNVSERPFCRVRQFWKQLGQAEEQKRVVYVWGDAGTGKSRGVKSYLKNSTVAYPGEKEDDLSPDHIEEPIVVVDSLLPDMDQKSQEYIRRLVTSDKWVLLISRSPIPEWLLDLHLQHSFQVIEGQELLLDIKDIKDLFAQYGFSLDRNSLETVRKVTKGYPAAVTIAAEKYRRDIDTEDWMRKTRQSFYQYLNYRICSTMSREEESLMQAIACLGKFPVTVEIAERISGLSGCHQLLEEIAKKEGFLLKDRDGYTLQSMETDLFRWKSELEIGGGLINALGNITDKSKIMSVHWSVLKNAEMRMPYLQF